MSTLPPVAEMQAAYLRRDAAYDGIFFVGVRTTGTFCRPTCKVRSPLPKNVEFFATAAEALFAGYRPCKRCRPLDTSNQPDWATSLIAQVEAAPSVRITDSDLRKLDVDPATVRRHFIRQYGMTFQAYMRARRLSAAFTEIKNGTSLDGAAMNNGYESLSGFREAFEKSMGCTPGKSRQAGCVFLTWMPSPLGPLVAGATEDGICLLEFTDRRMLETQFATVRKLFQTPVLPGDNKHLDRLRRELDDYFAGKLRNFQVPLVYPGTTFQRKVWGELLKIPYGETRSYYDLAKAVGDAKAVRAVGTTNGRNRIGIVIPCHRVVNKDGNLGGYGGGLRRKQYLLNLEQLGVTRRDSHEKTRAMKQPAFA
jgi:AraC family transcriptional regulator, regulatory protein of adaptative response / methylated-DNA-[protein]-cysteine methyltransferase